jgi:2-hydroxychromene-2-carboxylate isomerase
VRARGVCGRTALFRAYWTQDLDVSDVAVQRSVLCPSVLDAALFDQLVQATKQESIKARLKAAGDEAVARGAYGAPTIFLTRSDETTPTMYFGADRLHLLARHLGVPIPTAFPPRPRL